VSALDDAVTEVGGGSTTPSSAVYDASTGDLILTFANPHGITADKITIDDDSLMFKCSKDNYATEHTYPRSIDPASTSNNELNNGELSIISTTTDTITVNVGTTRGHSYTSGGTVQKLKNYQNNIKQVRDLSIQKDPGGGGFNNSLASCSNVVSAVYTCVGIVTNMIKNGLDEVLATTGLTTTYPSDYDGQSHNTYGIKLFGEDNHSPGVGVIHQGPYVRNCTNFISNSIGMKVDGFNAEPGDQIDNGVTGEMNVDSYTQYNQGGIGVSITNGAYAQLVSIFTICDDIGHWTSDGGQCDITNSNCSFGNKGLVSSGVGDENSRSIYRYTGEVVDEVDVNSTRPDSIKVSGIGSIRPYGGQAIYFDKLYNEIQKIVVTNEGSGYNQNNPPLITLDDPVGPNGITAEVSANVNNLGHVTSIDIISSGSQYLSNPGYTVTNQNGGVGIAFTTVLDPSYYAIENTTKPSGGISTITLAQNLNNTVSVGSTVYFSRFSLQLATTIGVEWVGSGTDINSARPGIGGVAILDNEFVQEKGGKIIFTGTNQSGNFRIGPDVTINQLTGTITGRAFSQSLLNTVTPLIIALG